ncbi:MAG: KEOPS complex subunit Pcc1 [Aigarchaeota archaeon]|nr:KEOPS complex subunit Pcc1 [Aigarchaeota archaeon]MCX8193245.1 KEOPS complex subunit Pcc1 [Nitrososphaeria archaeon]MDW7986385.1 KEOPS complex subunit Pcc1 [Nitrososphaerota archaeon]
MLENSSKVKASATLILRFENAEIAEIALKSIQPDNYPLPRDLLIKMDIKDCEVYIYVESDRTVLSLLTTLDDILSMMNLALKSTETLIHEN